MPSSWLTKLVLALAFSVLPLQAIAETIQIFLCHSPSAATEMAGEPHAHPQSGHDHGDASQRAHRSDASDDSGGGHGDHFCCDAVATALPLSAKALTQQNFSSIVAAFEVRHDSAFLKLPQRPPLA
jgi:hypothetical protein